MRVGRLRGAIAASVAWPLYAQLLVAGGVIVVASLVVVAVTGTDQRVAQGGSPSSTSEISVDETPPSTTAGSTSSVTQGTEAGVTTVSPTAPAPTLGPSATRPVTSPSDLLDGGSVLELLRQIPVELEHRGGYDRDLFAVWSDLDGDGCDTRDEVLRAESLDPVQSDPKGCPVIAGRWYSAYDGQTIDDPGAVDIDHVVALKEAWDSGAWAWSPEQRIGYANDQTEARTLAAVSAVSNRDKGDRDPSNWLPSDQDRCRYISDWVAIKARWALSMDQSEWGRIENLLEGPCLGARIDP